MGFYYNKLMAMQEETSVEKAVEDGIQTPNDVGVDLNHVEDVIAGDEGIEAHKEEIEDAMEGIVGDPLDECMIIMYESEYNFNQLMKCIGIEELNEFAQGRDFILEGGNLKAFIENAKKILRGMWEKAKAIFNAAIDKVKQITGVNKKIIMSKQDKLTKGFESGNWNITGTYDFDIMMSIDYEPKVLAFMDNVNDLPSHIECVKAVSGIDVKNEDTAAIEMVEGLKAKYLVPKEYSRNDTHLLDVVFRIMNNDNPTVYLSNLYKKIDAEYSELISDMDRIESALGENDKDKLTEIVKLAQYEKNLQHMYFSTCFQIVKKCHDQARKIALIWLNAAGLNDKDIENDVDHPIKQFSYDHAVMPEMRKNVPATNVND